MAAADGQVLGTSKIVDHGPPAARFNLVIVAEGYRPADMGKFAADAQDFVSHLFATPPFDELQCAFNIYRVDVTSTDGGADDPPACGGTGALAATYFDASFCNSGIRRLLLVDSSSVRSVVDAQVPQWHQALVIVNSPVWGGAGGAIGTTSTAAGWENIAIHEMGHAVFGLADEYEYWAGCGLDTDRNSYQGGEPAEPNVTTRTDRDSLKWGSLVAAATALPTTANPDCSRCDAQANPVPASTVGAFEGARYYHCGVYRPQFDCMMRNLALFCAVCRKRIRETLSPYLAPCRAPVFKGSRGADCLLKILIYSLAVAVLSLFACITGMQCTIKRLRFMIKHCCSGNENQCIEL